MRQFTVLVGEPWDFEGPDGPSRLVTTHRGQVNGPNAKNWGTRFILLEVAHPFDLDGERVELLVASPRYVGDSVASVEANGGMIGLARVRPGVKLVAEESFAVEDVVYCMIGSIAPMGSNPSSQPTAFGGG
jgi:hypothetical protein